MTGIHFQILAIVSMVLTFSIKWVLGDFRLVDQKFPIVHNYDQFGTHAAKLYCIDSHSNGNILVSDWTDSMTLMDSNFEIIWS